MRESTRTRISGIVDKEHWHPIQVDEVCGRIEAGELSPAQITHLDALLSRVADYLPQQVDRKLLISTTAEWPTTGMRAARSALWRLFENSPLLRDLDSVIAARRDTGKEKYGTYRRRERQHSVFPEELPMLWQAALQEMTEGFPGIHASVPSPSMISTTRTKLCEFIRAARDAGAEEEMCLEAAVAYERSLVRRERPLAKPTILSSIRQVRDFSLYVGAPDEVSEHLRARVRVHESRARNSTPKKEAQVLTLPSYEGIFERAFDLLGEADRVQDPRIAQSLRNAAVAITLFCPFPLRVADTKLRFGEEILWDGSCYRFNLVISKTKRPFTAPISSTFGFFIDQMILQGSSENHLNELRDACIRTNRLLFVNYNGREPHVRYVSYLWQRTFGTGSHVARTKLHDEFGRLGTRGVELAMRACGHRTERTAEFYRTRAFETLSLERMHDDLAADITDAEWTEFFSAGQA